jgi:hypothetical protein
VPSLAYVVAFHLVRALAVPVVSAAPGDRTLAYVLLNIRIRLLIMAIVFKYSDSLWAPIFAHSANDLYAEMERHVQPLPDPILNRAALRRVLRNRGRIAHRILPRAVPP